MESIPVQEEWKAVVGYEGIYEVSSLGRIVSHKFKKSHILKSYIDNNGYRSQTLRKEGVQRNRQVHQLIAEAFLGHTPNGHKVVVDHIDGDKLNNNLSNLQLLSNRDNVNKSKIGFSSTFAGVYFCNTLNKWRSQIRVGSKRYTVGTFQNEKEAAEAYKNYLNKINNLLEND